MNNEEKTTSENLPSRRKSSPSFSWAISSLLKVWDFEFCLNLWMRALFGNVVHQPYPTPTTARPSRRKLCQLMSDMKSYVIQTRVRVCACAKRTVSLIRNANIFGQAGIGWFLTVLDRLLNSGQQASHCVVWVEVQESKSTLASEHSVWCN